MSAPRIDRNKAHEVLSVSVMGRIREASGPLEGVDIGRRIVLFLADRPAEIDAYARLTSDLRFPLSGTVVAFVRVSMAAIVDRLAGELMARNADLAKAL